MQSELKPCAHCGGEAYIDDDTMGHSVVCCGNIECRAQGPFRPTDDEAIAAWNTRASDAEITRLTEALRAAEEREKGLREALVKADEPHWFYAEGYEDRCLYSPDDAIDLLDFDAGEYVTEVATARPCRSIWCAVRVTDDEDADERFTFTEHDSEESARAALKGPSHDQ